MFRRGEMSCRQTKSRGRRLRHVTSRMKPRQRNEVRDADPLTADMLQDFLAGRLGTTEHGRVERMVARDGSAARLAEQLDDIRCLMRERHAVPREQIPGEWIALLERRAR